MLPTYEEADIRRIMSPAVAIETMRAAFRADGSGQTVVPSVINLEVPDTGSEFHVKAAYVAGMPHIAVKIASGNYGNPARGLPSGSGLIALFDAASGTPVALLLDNGFLTDIRTGAAGAVAAEVLACRQLDTVGILGSGTQARYQIACLREVRRFRRLLAWSPTRSHLERYCAEMRDAYRLDARAEPAPESVCRAADLLITTTPSRAPLVRAEWLRFGTHVTAVGADAPGKQELDPACFRTAELVVVDRLAQCAAFGELRGALAARLINLDEVHAELGAIVAGLRTGRTSDDQITVADLTGVGFQDTAIASAAYRALSPGA